MINLRGFIEVIKIVRNTRVLNIFFFILVNLCFTIIFDCFVNY